MAVTLQSPFARRQQLIADSQRDKKESGIDKIAKALGVAQQVTGIAVNVAGISENIANRKLKAEQATKLAAEADRADRGVLTQGEVQAKQLAGDIQPAPLGTAGAVQVDVQDPRGQVGAGITPQAFVSSKALAATQRKEQADISKRALEVKEAQRASEFQKSLDVRKRQADIAKERLDIEKGKRVQSKHVPGMGEALTITDAKTLKDATQFKAKFDRQINELIDLRDKFGGEVLNREAVARGKQLSKDLLLSYKNIAKLGVLSQSDEAIINAIIPSDPLQFTPFSSATGQDPIRAQLSKFKQDLNADFETSKATRLKAAEGSPQKNLQDLLAEAERRKSLNRTRPASNK